MLKKNAVGAVCVLTSLLSAGSGLAQAQFAPVPPSQVQPTPPPAPPATPAIAVPGEPRLTLMVRNAIVALNQANATGNYSVLRDMGTPNFQMSNNSARLGEIFASLRARKLDLSPVMFFPAKFLQTPVLQDGQVLRLVGFFPTTPEQVNFDIAYQLFGEQWMLAGISLNIAPPETPQASAAPPQAPRPTADASPAKPGEAKPIRIDLSQPAPSPAQPATPPKKPVAAKKPKPATQQTAAAQPGGPAASSSETPAQPAPAPSEAAEKPKSSETGSSWNPFAR